MSKKAIKLLTAWILQVRNYMPNGICPRHGAIKGEEPLPELFFEWTCPTCGMKLPSTEKHCPNSHDWADDGLDESVIGGSPF